MVSALVGWDFSCSARFSAGDCIEGEEGAAALGDRGPLSPLEAFIDNPSPEMFPDFFYRMHFAENMPRII
jgi:hypothetical protein